MQETLRKLKSKPVRSLLMVLLAIIALLAGYLLYQLVYPNQAKQTGQNSAFSSYHAILTAVSGTPQVKRPNDADFVNAAADQQVSEGDAVKTDANTTALLILPDNSVVSIDVSTEIEIKRLDNEDGQSNTTIFQKVGRIFSQVENIVGTKQNYQVETDTVIAAVRGTKFGSLLNSDQLGFFVTEHIIDLLFKESDKKFELNENQEFSAPPSTNPQDDQQFYGNVSLYQKDDDKFTEINDCIDSKLDQTKDEHASEYGFIQELSDELAKCDEVEPPKAEVQGDGDTAAVTPDPTPVPPPNPVVSGVTFTPAGTDVNCSWSGQNSELYKVSIGNTPGADNTVSWNTTKQVSFQFGQVPMVSGNKYYCNVEGIAAHATSGVQSSGGYLFDQSAASFNTTTSYPWGIGHYYYKTVTVNGSFSGMTVGQLQMRYKIKRISDGLYWDGNTTWTAAAPWLNATPSQTGAGVFQAIGTTPNVVLPNGYVNITYELYSTVFGRTYATFTTPNVYAYGP